MHEPDLALQVYVEHDDGFREGLTMATLSKLPAVFKKGGTTTAGNSSQVCSTPANCKAHS